MNVSSVHAVTSTYNPPQTQKAAPQPAPLASTEDKVTLSPEAQKASAGADVDRDGDSH